MNPLTSLLLLANPIVTAVLTVVLFLESKKQKSLLASVEKAIIDSSKQVIEAVERQKDGFDAIAASLNAISKDQEKSVETFTGISNALTTSSDKNHSSLENVASTLNSTTAKTEHIMTTLSQKIEQSNAELKSDLKIAYNAAAEAFDKAVTFQQSANENLAKLISSDVNALRDGIDANSKELSHIESTLKNAVSI